MSTFRTPQSSKTASRYSQSSAGQSSMRMSDLSSSQYANNNGGGFDHSMSALLGYSNNDSEFSQQLAASNSEIDAARYDIQVLMTKAHAYCKNSGLGNTDLHLVKTPPRFSGKLTPRSSKMSYFSTNQGEFFSSTVNHPITP